jgi:hypothetical protein
MPYLFGIPDSAVAVGNTERKPFPRQLPVLLHLTEIRRIFGFHESYITEHQQEV